jgi:FkbM family methyltransferase
VEDSAGAWGREISMALAQRLSKILKLPLSLIPRDAEVPILRGPLRGKKWIVGAASHAYWVGTYEVDILNAFAASITQGATVYDVGANVGIYSLLAGSRTGPSGKVYAFEPLERNLEYLRRHMTLNHVQNCVIFETAVCDTEGTRRFARAAQDFSMGHFSSEGEMLVPSITLDNCIYGEKGLRPPSVAKIDVEGAELEVLQGASQALSEFHPKIFLEIHGTQLHSDCRAFLVAKGYSIEDKYGRLTATWKIGA